MRKHRWGKQLLVVLCCVFVVFLAGCRPSPVLEQIIYEQNHEVNPDTETKTMNDDLENEEPDENIPSRRTTDDSEQITDQEYTSALAGDSDTLEDPDAVYDVAYSPSGDLSEPDETNPTEDSTSEKATGSTEAGGDEGGYAPSGEGQETGTEGVAGGELTGGGNGDADDNGLEGGTGVKRTKERVMKQFVDDSGNTWDIPTEVDTVVAAGEVAPIVEMLGGSGRLVGSSSSFTGNSLAQSAFDLNEVKTWWEGDGSSTISEGSFQALLTVNPDVCFEISGQDTFSEAQIATLKENNIGYVALPQLNSIKNIEDAVTVVGKVLGGDAENIASNYCNWANNVISTANRNYSTKATTYIALWDDEAAWSITNDYTGELASGSGVPIAYRNTSSVLSECMDYVNLACTASNTYYYVEPLRQLTYVPNIYGYSANFRPSIVKTIYSDVVGAGLGTELYPAVIVDDESIRINIRNAEGGEYFRYHWLAGEFMQFPTTTGYGIEDGLGGFIPTYIQHDIKYKIIVNPSGVGSWANGSVESPLEAVWLAYEFQGLNVDMQSMVSEFYSTFYHYDGVDTSAIMPADWTYDR